jgi:hypothetical protein
MTWAETIMTALLTRAIEAGEVELRGTQLYQGGRRVMPQLLFVADQEPPTSTAAAGIRRSAGGQHEENDSTYPKFAPLPPDRLVPADKATADRARMAQQRPSPAEPPRQGREGAQRLRWPGNFAPLPPDALIRKNR